MKVRFVRLREQATVPARGTAGAGCYDLYAADSAVVSQFDRRPVKVPLGLAFEIPEGFGSTGR